MKGMPVREVRREKNLLTLRRGTRKQRTSHDPCLIRIQRRKNLEKKKKGGGERSTGDRPKEPCQS